MEHTVVENRNFRKEEAKQQREGLAGEKLTHAFRRRNSRRKIWLWEGDVLKKKMRLALADETIAQFSATSLSHQTIPWAQETGSGLRACGKRGGGGSGAGVGNKGATEPY